MAIEESGINILVVDDEHEICELITAFLSTFDRIDHIVTAKDGAEAFYKLSNQEFSLIIADQNMPRKTGLDLAQIIKRLPPKKRPKIILISGALVSDDVMKAVMYGVKSILVKPFTRADLIKLIEKELEL